MLPTIIEKSLNTLGESARPGLEPESHPSAAEPPRSVRSYWCRPAAHEHRQGALLEQLRQRQRGQQRGEWRRAERERCHDGVKQLAAAVNGAGWGASFNCRRDYEKGDAGGGGAGGKGEGRVEDDEGRLGARGNGLGGAVGGADGDSLHAKSLRLEVPLRHVSCASKSHFDVTPPFYS